MPILSDEEYAKLEPTDPEEELRKAVECAAARAPEDYTTYHLLRSIAASLIRVYNSRRCDHSSDF